MQVTCYDGSGNYNMATGLHVSPLLFGVLKTTNVPRMACGGFVDMVDDIYMIYPQDDRVTMAKSCGRVSWTT